MSYCPANPRRERHRRVLVRDAGIGHDVAVAAGTVERADGLARIRGAVLIVRGLSDERQNREIVLAAGAIVDVAFDRVLTAVLQCEPVRRGFARIERTAVAVREDLVPDRARECVAPAQVRRRAQHLHVREVKIRADAVPELERRPGGIDADRRDLVHDAGERVVALALIAGQRDGRRRDPGRGQLRADDVPSRLGDQSLRDRHRVEVEHRVADLSAAHDRVRERVEIDAGDAGDRALHGPGAVVREPRARRGRRVRLRRRAAHGERIGRHPDAERAGDRAHLADRVQRAREAEGDDRRLARQDGVFRAHRALVVAMFDGERVRIGGDAEQREPSAHVGRRLVAPGRRGGDDARAGDRCALARSEPCR